MTTDQADQSHLTNPSEGCRYEARTDWLRNIRIARIRSSVTRVGHANFNANTVRIPMAIAKKVAKPAKKTAAAKAATQATVTLKHLAAELADSHEIAKKQAGPCWAIW
jgi:hypothetical protein